jgi:ribosome-associated protein
MILVVIALSSRHTRHYPHHVTQTQKRLFRPRSSLLPKAANSTWSSRRELKGTNDASRTDLKRESTELQKLGEER